MLQRELIRTSSGHTSRFGTARTIHRIQDRHDHTAGSSANFQYSGSISSLDGVGCMLYEGFSGRSWDERTPIDCEGPPMEPCLPYEILHRLLCAGTANPITEQFAFFCTGHPFRFHVETQAITLQGCRDQKFGANTRGVNVMLIQSSGNPLQELPCRPHCARRAVGF